MEHGIALQVANWPRPGRAYPPKPNLTYGRVPGQAIRCFAGSHRRGAAPASPVERASGCPSGPFLNTVSPTGTRLWPLVDDRPFDQPQPQPVRSTRAERSSHRMSGDHRGSPDHAGSLFRRQSSGGWIGFAAAFAGAASVAPAAFAPTDPGHAAGRKRVRSSPRRVGRPFRRDAFAGPSALLTRLVTAHGGPRAGPRMAARPAFLGDGRPIPERHHPVRGNREHEPLTDDLPLWWVAHSP